jgi:hypothetical protein
MKKIALIASLLISTLAFGQEVDLPDAVIKAFEEKFSDAENVTWKLVKTNYQATFEEIEITMALFSPEGEWLKTVMIISEDDLPVMAIEHIEDNYEDAEINQVQMIKNNKEEITYLVVLMVDDEKVKIKFNKEGVVI